MSENTSKPGLNGAVPKPGKRDGDRIRRNTATQVRQRIDAQLKADVRFYGRQGSEGISKRLAELDREWHVDRALMTAAGVNVLIGLLLGRLVNRAWYLFPAVVGGFLIQHTLQGWCPPLPIFRRLGFRTSREIAREKYALKTIRGDFRDVASDTSATPECVERVLSAVT